MRQLFALLSTLLPEHHQLVTRQEPGNEDSLWWRSARSVLLSRVFLLSTVFGYLLTPCPADGTTDNQDAQVRRIPPIGVDLKPADRDELLQAVAEIERSLPVSQTPSSLNTDSDKVDWWNDIQVVSRAIKLTVEGQQFTKDTEIDQAKKLLVLARERIEELKSSAASQPGYVPTWAKQSGRIIAGHRSRLDDSVQPFGLWVPEGATITPKQARRLDIWLHGRDENVSEVTFLYRRWTSDSPYLPEDAFVLQPWGRYSNAFRFAGEVDVFEALTEVQRRYTIDPDRISVRGFSMGGAGCWHLAVHHPDRFFAANPGAGFCETERFLTGFQSEKLNPTPAQKKLWSLYDCPPAVRNLTNLPTIAYSGGIDRQKEAADIMTEAATKAGFSIPYVIHPESAHVIHPDSKREIEEKMSVLAKSGRRALPLTISWSTHSLKYPGAYWIRLTGLEQHWTEATIDASLSDDLKTLHVKTSNVRSFEIDVPLDLDMTKQDNKSMRVAVVIDGNDVGPVQLNENGKVHNAFERIEKDWKNALTEKASQPRSLQKRPGLQGPIDDAFLERFIIVRPTGRSKSPALDAWVERELQHAIVHWRLQFRGDARVKLDTEITDADLQESNVICFGTPESNRLIAKMLDRLPIRWKDDELAIGSQRFDATKAVPVMIYPNPLAQHRYVVFNSGFTYREYDYLNNARQTPKLPDWAIIDATSPQTTRAAGSILAEGFYDEQWQP